jgi:pimeloyl-ACP methyl ester carboxylesterase
MNATLDLAAADRTAIRHFHVNVPEARLTDLRKRINATVWPEHETAGDASSGVKLATLQKLAGHWATGYDWRQLEKKLNALPNFITRIDGLDFHFIHVRSKHDDALPLIVTHGWPGSIVEQLKIVDPLVNPTAHGGSAADAFHLVIPSMAGYGFSGKPAGPGWDTTRMARAWAVLMKRLGYTRYVAQGGDWGSFVTEQMAAQAPPGLLGIHLNLQSAVPTGIFYALGSGKPPPGLEPEEQRAFERLAFFFANGLSYAQQMANHPHALYGLGDSPVGLAAWILDNDLWGDELRANILDGRHDGLTPDDLLDNITLYWLTNTAISAAGLYRENKLPFFAPMGIEIPVAVTVFPGEIFQLPHSWARRAYPQLMHYNRAESGGHFAAWEQPRILSGEIRTAFRPLRM